MQATIEMDLKQLRLRAGLSAEKVAVALEKSHSTVRNWESGKSRPTLDVSDTVRLCKLYHCTLEELEQAVNGTDQGGGAK